MSPSNPAGKPLPGWTAFVFVCVAACARLIPHLPNFTPVNSAALFSGSKLPNLGLAIAAPLSAMLASDLFLHITYRAGWHNTQGFHEGQWVVYLAIAMIVVLGRVLLKRPNLISVAGVALLASSLFFVMTNLEEWYRVYPHSWLGLQECFTLALPFFGYTIASDLCYSLSFFGAWSLIENRRLHGAFWPSAKSAVKSN